MLTSPLIIFKQADKNQIRFVNDKRRESGKASYFSSFLGSFAAREDALAPAQPCCCSSDQQQAARRRPSRPSHSLLVKKKGPKLLSTILFHLLLSIITPCLVSGKPLLGTKSTSVYWASTKTTCTKASRGHCRGLFSPHKSYSCPCLPIAASEVW